MRRNVNRIHNGYINTRVQQLMDDANKARREEDKQWYYRVCQELQWAEQAMKGEYSKDCVLAGRV